MAHLFTSTSLRGPDGALAKLSAAEDIRGTQEGVELVFDGESLGTGALLMTSECVQRSGRGAEGGGGGMLGSLGRAPRSPAC